MRVSLIRLTAALLVAPVGCAMTEPWRSTQPVYSIGADVKPPKEIDDGSLLVPKTLHPSHSGCEEVKLIVDETGKPQQVEPAGGPSSPVSPWALASAQDLLFQPATKAGFPVAVRVVVDECVSMF